MSGLQKLDETIHITISIIIILMFISLSLLYVINVKKRDKYKKYYGKKLQIVIL